MLRSVSQSRPPQKRALPKNPAPALREVTVEKILDGFHGGSQSIAAGGIIDGDNRFLKAPEVTDNSRPQERNYANFESELLAHEIFSLIGIKSPESEIVRIKGASPFHESLGNVVLSMELVDEEFVEGRKLHKSSGWGIPKKGKSEDFLKVSLVDILIGNADRRDANLMLREDQNGQLLPVPIDNNSGFGNLANWKYPTNHCNFVKSYGGSVDEPGLRQLGSIANIYVDITLADDLFDTEAERTMAKELALELKAKLSDQEIDKMVDALPREIIPDAAGVPEHQGDPQMLKTLLNGVRPGSEGDELFRDRKIQLKETLKWRRDNLPKALDKFLTDFANPKVDPIEDCRKDWNLLY